jgi:ABC-type sugar transport system substrate-binding protein
MKKFYLVTFTVLIVALFSLVAFGQDVCTLEALKASYPNAEKLIEENENLFVENGIVYENFTAKEALPLPRIVTGRPVRVGYMTLGPIMQVKRHCHQALIECVHRGWDITYYEATTPMKMREAMDNAITSNVDALVITYWTMPAIEDQMIAARKKGIGVYVIDTQLQQGALLSSTAEQGVGAAQMAYYMLSQMGYQGKVGIVTMARELAERERRDVIRALMLAYGVEVVAAEDLTNQDTQMDDAFKWAQNMITKYGKDLDWLIGIWDGLGVSCANAIEQAGMADSIFTTGMDGGDQVFDMVRNGKGIRCIAVQPYEWYTHMGFEAINQLQVKGIPPLAPESYIDKGRIIFYKQVLVTRENIPPVGTSIHALWTGYTDDKYSKALGEEWWNWPEVNGPYIMGQMDTMAVYAKDVPELNKK